jgi:primosomal protein N' (replication factor Y)
MSSQLIFRDSSEDESEYQLWFAEVVLPISVPQTYTYRIPTELHGQIFPGQRVVVQFGKKKIYTALVVSLHQEPPKSHTAKYLLEPLDSRPIISELQLDFWKWMAAYYCCTLGDVMDAALPGNMKMESETKITLNPDRYTGYVEFPEKESRILEALEKQQIMTIAEISELMGQKTVLPLIKGLYEKGVLLLKEELNDTFRPKKEVFVTHEFDMDDKALKEELFKSLEKAPRQSDVLLAYIQLQQEGKPLMRRTLLKLAKTTASVLDALVDKNILSLFEEEVDRVTDTQGKGWDYTLNEEQQSALKDVREKFTQKDVVLLHGVTGSGKTHIFMELIDEVIEEGRQALYLVPEIALTAQLIQRLRSKYGKDIGIYHSKFNTDERVEIWNKVLNKTYKVVLGVRSALFLPFQDLGLLVIDEEHEHTFKQYEPAPRYHARDSGIYLMNLFGGKPILGSATPSFESYFNAQRGKYGMVKLNGRFGEIKMPEMLLADLREEQRKKTMKSHFSSVLYTEMQKTIQHGGQVILFQNRRGYAPLLECTTCGWTPMCQNCDISLTYHQMSKEIRCHYCGYKEESPKKCRACGNFTLKMLGFGTEKIEDELNIFFPEYKSLRMDQDTTRGKNAYTKIINALEDGEAQILVGTQMVTKGLDFENVRLVGILNADQMLRYPDFRAQERSYQLMSQVSGRAGRRNIQGKVVIQTYNPLHPLFGYLLKHDYEGFYANEIAERLDFKYPPFYKLIKLMVRDESQDKVKKAAHWIADRLRDIYGHRVLGPEFPPIARIRGRYTMNVLLKFERLNMNMPEAKLILTKEIGHFKTQKDFKGIRLIVDVDPY